MTHEVSFERTRVEDALIKAITMRVINEGQFGVKRLSLMMDLVATHTNGCPLDFAKLLAFDAFNFSHDISGIVNCIDRETGKLGSCFRPRCALPTTPGEQK